MRLKFLIIPPVLFFQIAVAQNGAKTQTLSQNPGTSVSKNTPSVNTTKSQSGPTVTAISNSISPANTSSGQNTVTGLTGSTDNGSSADSPSLSMPLSSQTAIMDYKNVYEAPTIDEEVKMAAERFNLTPAQQDMWRTAAVDRRDAEKIARGQLEQRTDNYDRAPVYKGLRMAQNTFYETIIGYLNPAQKQALETDRLILEEKRKQLAKIAPPPVAPTVTVAPVDSTAIKAEMEKTSGKKSKKKKKAVGA